MDVEDCLISFLLRGRLLEYKVAIMFSVSHINITMKIQMKRLTILTLVASICAGCATPRAPFNDEGIKAEYSTYHSCVAQHSKPLMGGTDDAIKIATVAVSFCETELEELSKALQKERNNQGYGYSHVFASEFKKGYRQRVINKVASIVMEERAKQYPLKIK